MKKTKDERIELRPYGYFENIEAIIITHSFVQSSSLRLRILPIVLCSPYLCQFYYPTHWRREFAGFAL